MLELDDIQGLVLSGYARAPFARYFMLRFGERGAAEWLSRVLPRITTSERRERRAPRPLNVALGASGLVALGLDEPTVATFPAAFCRGMHAPERSAALGDVGDAAEGWEFGGSDGTRVDALVLSYARTADELDEESDALEEGFERFGIESHAEDVYLPSDHRGHFGFVDARTNPRLRGGPGWWRLRQPARALPAGEIVLGYRNAAGRRAEGPRGPVRYGARTLPPRVDALRAMDLGRNGTFVALRKLEQDVASFWGFAELAGAGLWSGSADAGQRLAEAMVGRSQDGAKIPGCPIGAHVARASESRLVRRGRLYGPKLARGEPADGQPRGLMFLALTADLEGRFEILQQELLNGEKFGGLTHERDPLVGRRTGGADDTFSVQGEPYRRSIRLERFVRVRGGAYLFLPGLRTLSYLAEGRAP